ncbi:Pentatricopeptide repeat [Melia azedarach]|uniref:Pentatricopeptide repeat n=2 Tax=Melia azedarach TaxID=155640 RepID=A0ACC1X0H2_MELAZ|nr:Pentatricopeptide repeat [Melia azedarach]KAJ4704945.1 Pentatricopeptide repeat [Melia azedarach]
MQRFSVSRFLWLSVHVKNFKVCNLHFTTNSSAEKYYGVLQKNPKNVERTLVTVKAKLDSNCVNEVLRRCLPGQSQMAIRFFIWAGLQSSYRHSPFTYNKVCELFKVKQNPRIVIDVVEAYREESCVVSVKTMKMILNLCEKAKLANEALWVLRKMPEFNLRPDTIMYNIVIRLFCVRGDMVMADKLMKEMGLISLYPDIITNVLMIKGYCNAGRLEDACGLFKAMRRYGCVTNSVAYSALLDGICRSGSMERALELLGEMEKEGGDCRPNVVTYTSVIQSFCEKGMMVEALGLLDRMNACGCAPNRVTVSTLIKGLCGEGNVNEAYKLIDKVIAGGSVSSGDCYSSLVVELVRTNRLGDAEKLFSEMLVSGVKPDGLACSIIFKELILWGKVLDVFRLYEEIENIGFLSSIDSDIYSILLLGLCQESHSVEAVKLARFMLEKGIRLQAPYVGKIVEHLKKFQDKELLDIVDHGLC